jgi:acyl-CoA synthetase (AMP-forming)/AMP-acid ligase II
MLENSESSVLVLDPAFVPALEPLVPEIASVRHYVTLTSPARAPGRIAGRALVDYETLLQGGSAREPDARVEEDDLYLLLYTSGTTGVLKAAMLTHRNWLALTRQTLMMQGLEHGSDVRRCYAAPVTHAAGTGVLPTLVAGGLNVLLPTFDVELLLETIQRHRITDLLLVPTMINLVMAHPKLDRYDLGSLRTLTYGASPMPPERVKQALEVFGPILVQGYGQTESTAIISTLSKEDHVTGGDPRKEARLASAGRPAFECEVRIVDDAGNDVAPGEVGEIVVRGPNVMAGYWRAPDLTAETLVDGWLHTRDMGRVDGQGYLYLVDRKSDMIISGGFNIYPSEVENVLYTHPAVYEAAVVPVPDEKYGEAVKAVVVLRPGAEAGEADLIAHCRANLASYKKPQSVDFVDELPKSPVGKILRRAVREPYWAGKDRRVH